MRWLCGVEADRLAYGPARTKGEKGRTAAWFTLHLGTGGIIAGMSLAVPPFAAALIALPFVPALRYERAGLPGVLHHPWALALTPVAGAAMLVALAGCAAGCGALLARWAPALLGPSPEDRVAAPRRTRRRPRRPQPGSRASCTTRRPRPERGHPPGERGPPAPGHRPGVRPRGARRDRGHHAPHGRRTRRRAGRPAGRRRARHRAGADARRRPRRPAAPHPRGRTAGDGHRHHRPEALPPLVSREAYRIVQEGLSNALRARRRTGRRCAARRRAGRSPADHRRESCRRGRRDGGHAAPLVAATACAASPTGPPAGRRGGGGRRRGGRGGSTYDCR